MRNPRLLLVMAFTVVASLSPATGQWDRNTIGSNIIGLTSFNQADLDGDGDVDVVSATAYSGLIFYENDGNANWTRNVISEIGGVGVFIFDLDEDGMLDVVYNSYATGEILWFRNLGGSPLTWTSNLVGTFGGPEFSYVDDIDNDGDPDIVSTDYSTNRVAWFENDGTAATWTMHLINSELNSPANCHVADIDGDGMKDVISHASQSSYVAWFRNENAGQNWTRYDIDNALSKSGEIDVADYDSDGDPDVLATGNSIHDVVLYENNRSDTVTWAKHIIDGSLTGAFATKFADVNGDGLLDAVATGNAANEVVWYRNDGNSPDGWMKYTIDSNLPLAWEINAADLDGDGFLDVIANQIYTMAGSIVWYRNPSGDSIDAFLNSLSFDPDPVTMDPEFDPMIFIYTVVMPDGTESVTVTASPHYPDASVDGTGEVILSGGSGTAMITVTSADGSNTTTYTLNITSSSPEGVYENILKEMKVYPGISNGTFTAEFPGDKGTLCVIDLTGGIISSRKVTSSLETIHINVPGIFVIRMEYEGVSKLVKVMNTQ